MARSSRTTRPRLIIADDHQLVLESFCSALATEFAIVGTARDGVRLVEVVRHRAADCLLLDLQMPGRSGMELLPTIHRLQPHLRIVVVTMMADRRLADCALNSGAHGFLPKEAPFAELRLAIREVLSGRRYRSPLLPKSGHRLGADAEHVALARLTSRQQQILLLLGEGRHAVDVAEGLHVSPSTITFHKHNIMRALGIDSDEGLLRFAVLVRSGTRPAPVIR